MCQQFVTLCGQFVSTVYGTVYEQCDAMYQQFVTLCGQFVSTVYGTVYEQCVTPCVNSL